ncbi:MAG: pitrilysin family protein [Clostridia bacterium]
MEYNEIKIKKGINLYTIKTEKFKTNLIAVMLTTKLNRENVTKNALIPAVLRRGTANMQTLEKINKTLEGMYGASFDCGLDKTGENQVLKFYLETVNDEFLPTNTENIFKESIQKLFEIIFNPYLENNCFKKEYVKQEKENLKQIIEGKIDSKARYALDRCIEEMYKNEPFGLYKYGYVEDLEKINEQNLYQYYLELINQCKIDIFVSGLIDDGTRNIIEENNNIKKLKEREADYQKLDIGKKKNEEIKKIQESMEVNQGKLIIGLDVNTENKEDRFNTIIYNSLLGGSANSKLFQNVREKASLAYTASSSYFRLKNNIFINCGIDIPNYEKTVEIIKQQIEDMKNGKFTNEEIENAKKGIIDSIKGIDDEQDTEITYFFGQELSGENMSLEEYMNSIRNVSREGIQDIANKITINTIYFLKN